MSINVPKTNLSLKKIKNKFSVTHLFLRQFGMMRVNDLKEKKQTNNTLPKEESHKRTTENFGQPLLCAVLMLLNCKKNWKTVIQCKDVIN